ncbi:hypothetical protein [Parasynechococcus sp.]|uniref:hypothetical protein n=1 Tax=Parasynechococcus sp. TaxID=3101203 RepID=UPI0037041C5E
MAIDRATIERIDSTLLPPLDRHHVRVLSHCLDSFQCMTAPGNTGAVPDENQRRRWCQQQPVVADDPAFFSTLLLQLNAAAEQLDQLALELGKPPLALTLDDLINAAEARCRG